LKLDEETFEIGEIIQKGKKEEEDGEGQDPRGGGSLPGPVTSKWTPNLSAR